MPAREIAAMYESAGIQIFRTGLFPYWLRRLWALVLPSSFSPEPLKHLLREACKRYTGNPDLTLGELGQRLRPGQSFVITTLDLLQRRTRFLKTYDPKDADWKLWEAVLASTAAPTVFPIVKRNEVYYTDGGMGSYNNPAYVAAHEAVDWCKHPIGDISLFSFGTGWLTPDAYLNSDGEPTNWRAMKWITNIPTTQAADSVRTQSLDIIEDFFVEDDPAASMDFRRFQLRLDEEINSFEASEEIVARLKVYGEQLGEQILNNQHALGEQDGFDPEGLRAVIERYRHSKSGGLRIQPL